jgi:hypothetical protein
MRQRMLRAQHQHGEQDDEQEEEAGLEVAAGASGRVTCRCSWVTRPGCGSSRGSWRLARGRHSARKKPRSPPLPVVQSFTFGAPGVGGGHRHARRGRPSAREFLLSRAAVA